MAGLSLSPTPYRRGFSFPLRPPPDCLDDSAERFARNRSSRSPRYNSAEIPTHVQELAPASAGAFFLDISGIALTVFLHQSFTQPSQHRSCDGPFGCPDTTVGVSLPEPRLPPEAGLFFRPRPRFHAAIRATDRTSRKHEAERAMRLPPIVVGV
jgi:hypothetical protein